MSPMSPPALSPPSSGERSSCSIVSPASPPDAPPKPASIDMSPPAHSSDSRLADPHRDRYGRPCHGITLTPRSRLTL
eukprot:6212764-Pleurochrysis_carterae.AAC.5